MDFKRTWQHFLVDINKTGAEVAADVGQTAPNLNKKIRNETIRLVEFAEILEHYGYTLAIVKKEQQEGETMRFLGYGVFKNNVLVTYHGAWAVFPDKSQAFECIGNMEQIIKMFQVLLYNQKVIIKNLNLS